MLKQKDKMEDKNMKSKISKELGSGLSNGLPIQSQFNLMTKGFLILF